MCKCIKKNVPIRFSHVESKIRQALHDIDFESIGIHENVTLVTDFLNTSCNDELSSALITGGPTIPMIILLGDSGRIYHFALKSLIDL